jgi:hypothetical protein
MTKTVSPDNSSVLDRGLLEKYRSKDGLRRYRKEKTGQGTTRKELTVVLTVLFCVLGLVQIVPAVRDAIQDKTGDLGRQWIVTHYVLRGANPYPIALEALRDQYGALAPHGPVHLRDTQISDIPKLGPNAKTDPAVGTPEATYPPGSVMMLVPLGLLPMGTVAFMWVFLNLALVIIVAWELNTLAHSDEVSWLFFLGLVAVWPAVAICIEREQFSLLCLCCILVAFRIQSSRPILAGLLYSLALLKPSIAIPFLVLPLLDAETSLTTKIRTVVTLGVSQLALLAGMCWMVSENPANLLAGWLGVAGYFRQGIYTVQEFINRLRLDGSAADFGLQICVLLSGIFFAYKAPDKTKRLAVLAIVSCIWTYHARHDFVILLIPAALLVVTPINRRWVVDFAALVFMAIGLFEFVYHGTGTLSAVLRMAARLSMAALLIGVALDWLTALRLQQHSPSRASWAQ